MISHRACPLQAMEDEEIREEALIPLASVNDPEVAVLLVEALNDSSEDVRATSLEIAEERGDDIGLSVMKEAIFSEYDDVKYPIFTKKIDYLAPIIAREASTYDVFA